MAFVQNYYQDGNKIESKQLDALANVITYVDVHGQLYEVDHFIRYGNITDIYLGEKVISLDQMLYP